MVFQFICAHSVVSDSATPWTVARQAPLSMGFSWQESGVGCHFFSSLFIRMHICGCLSLWFLLSCTCSASSGFYFFVVLVSLSCESSPQCLLWSSIYILKWVRKKKIPAEALCQCVYRMGEGQLVNPWPSVFHDHVGSRIFYRDQTTSTPFPPCSLSFRDKSSNLPLGSLSFTVHFFFFNKSRM